MLIFFAWLREQVLDFIFCFVQFLEFSAYQFQLGIHCYVFLFTYHNNSFGKIKTDVKIGIFLIPIAYWSGFGFFKQNRDGLTVCIFDSSGTYFINRLLKNGTPFI